MQTLKLSDCMMYVHGRCVSLKVTFAWRGSIYVDNHSCWQSSMRSFCLMSAVIWLWGKKKICVFTVTCWIFILFLLYARLQTGRIMVLWCPSGSPSVRLSDSLSICLGLRPPVFCTFLLHAFTYWAEILHITLMYFRSSSSVITFRQFLKELCLFVNSEYRKYAVFRTFLLHALTYWAEILLWLCFNVLQIKLEFRHFASIFEGVMPLCELRI